MCYQCRSGLRAEVKTNGKLRILLRNYPWKENIETLVLWL